MFQFLQVTAQYSNAVLVAILPHVSEFSERLELPIPIPIVTRHVERFVCNPFEGDVGGYVTLTNGAEFWFEHGFVNGFRTPRSYFNLQNPADIPKFFGTLHLNKEDALQMARNSLLKLGYSLKETFADQEPEIAGPIHIGSNTVPHYRFQWKDPVSGEDAVDIEIDAAKKTIQMMTLSSPFLWRNPLEIEIKPALLNPRPAISVAESNKLVLTLIRDSAEMAKSFKLPINQPLTSNQVERLEIVDREWDVRLKLTNGYWFSFSGGCLSGFNTPDSVYGFQPGERRRPLDEYLGMWTISEKRAVERAREAIRKAGYKETDFNADKPPQIEKKKQVGNYVVPRYWIRWLTNDPKTGLTIMNASVEVDGEDESVKYLHLWNGRLTRNPEGTNKGNTLPLSPQNGATPQLFFKTNAPSKQPKPVTPRGEFE